MKGPVQSLEATYLVHATEDPMKLQRAVQGLLQTQAAPGVEELEGHFGNRIIRARFHLTGEEAALAIANIFGKMPLKLRKEILAQIPSYLDEHSALFLRLDKQELVSGSIALGSGDPVRLKVKPRLFVVKGSAPQFYARLIEGS
jgi:RNA binding exosome subunit